MQARTRNTMITLVLVGLFLNLALAITLLG